MPNNMTAEQLRSWYQDFSEVLYREVNIDVTRKEDLGRVQIHRIYQWDLEGPEFALSHAQYAYIPHDGETYRVAPPARTDKKAYGEWLVNSQNPEPDTEQIRELYEMAQKGTLIVMGPEGGADSYRQVQIADGKTVISIKANDIPHRRPADAPEDYDGFVLPEPPEAVAKPVAPEAPKPFVQEAPEPPENPNPGFFSWLGYIFGRNTDYAKKKRMEEYQQALEEWQAENLEYMDEYEAYENALADWETQNTQQMERYRSHPLTVLHCIHGGVTARWADDQFVTALREDSVFWMRKHQQTPMGQMHRMTESMLAYTLQEEDALSRVHDLMGPSFFLSPRTVKKLQLAEDFTAKNYKLPATNNGAIQLRKLAEFVCFAAFTDPSVGSRLPIPGLSPEDATRQNFTHVLNDMFTYGRKINQYAQLIEPARMKGVEALEQYAQGNAAPVAKLFSDNLRALNREAAGICCDSHHGYCCFSILSKIAGLAKQDPNLAQAMDLTPEEWAEIDANVAYFNIAKKGMESTKALMAHGRYQQTLSPEQVREAVCDVLLATYLDSVSIAENNAWSESLQNSQRFQDKFMENARYANAFSLRLQANNAEKAKAPNAKQLAQQANQAMDKNLQTSAELNLLYLERPIPLTRSQLTNPDRVAELRQQLLDNPGVKKLLEQPPQALGIALTDPASVRKLLAGEQKPVPANDLHHENVKNASLIV